VTAFHSALYRGDLVHARHEGGKRALRYGVYVGVLDLDELTALHRELRLFSHRKRNLFSFDDRDYTATLSPAQACADDLQSSLAALRAANGLPTPATTRLVTNLRVLGYGFNPVSFFLDYDARGALSSVIAEVNNTYGGRFRYVLGARERITRDRRHRAGLVGFRHVRELFVSPFLHGAATYDFWFDAPLDGDTLAIDMHVQRGATDLGDTRALTARLTGARVPLSDRTLLATALRYPLMTAQVIGLIHFEALKMRLAGRPYRRPERDHRPLAI
jgi:DUF1365 family protein